MRPAGFDEPAGLAGLEQLLSQDPGGVAGEKPRPKLAERGEVKARVRQFEPQEILPIQPCTHGVGGLLVSELLAKLQDRHQSEAPRRIGWLPLLRKERHKIRVAEDGAELVTELPRDIPFGEGGAVSAGMG